MRYWWVSHNQTYAQEVPGGYIWSPKTRADGARSEFYENMRLVEPGDLIVSFAQSRIKALGRALGTAYEAPRPEEFGSVGEVWAKSGRRVEVDFEELPSSQQVRPKDFIDELAPLLPSKYSPLTQSGNGLQNVYLAAIPADMAEVILAHVGRRTPAAGTGTDTPDPDSAKEALEERLLKFIEQTPLAETEKQALVASRRGQGRFRDGVLLVEPVCRVTGVGSQDLLTASHIRPWSRCETHQQRLDPFNGLMLTPTIDRLFDRGLISFTDAGDLLVSPRLDAQDLHRLGLRDGLNVGPFRAEQREYLGYHRDHVFKAS